MIFWNNSIAATITIQIIKRKKKSLKIRWSKSCRTLKALNSSVKSLIFPLELKKKTPLIEYASLRSRYHKKKSLANKMISSTFQCWNPQIILNFPSEYITNNEERNYKTAKSSKYGTNWKRVVANSKKIRCIQEILEHSLRAIHRNSPIFKM